MTNPYRAMCAELHAAFNTYAVDMKHHDLLERARALLAQPVAEGPTDEEVMELMPQQMRDDLAAAARAMIGFDNPKAAGAIRIILNRHAVYHARAVLAKWSRPTPQPPTDGEVTELVEWLQSMRDLAGEHNPDEQRRYTRAAELLERLASDNAGLTAAADSLWADNVSLLDN